MKKETKDATQTNAATYKSCKSSTPRSRNCSIYEKTKARDKKREELERIGNIIEMLADILRETGGHFEF